MKERDDDDVFQLGPLWFHSPVSDLSAIENCWHNETRINGHLELLWDGFSQPVAIIGKDEGGALTCRINPEIAGTLLRNRAVTSRFAEWIGGSDGDELCRKINFVCQEECLTIKGTIAVFLDVWLERHGWVKRG